MTKLLWDQAGQRLYEAGLDRGVLYKEDTFGVPWNGLTSIDENLSNIASDPIYFDGVKYIDQPKVGDFSATLNAYTYPDEFLEYEGLQSLGGGLFVDDQRPKQFGLSYRTKVGNDVDGLDHGYKIHIIYNLTAVPQAETYETLSNSVTPVPFSWQISAVPVPLFGFRPTAHFIFDSRFLPPEILTVIESILYGTDSVDVGDYIYDGGNAFNGLIDGGTAAYTTPDVLDFDDGLDVELDLLLPGLPLIDGGGANANNQELPGALSTPASEPRLPPIQEFIDLITLFGPRFIVPDPTTGLALLVNGDGDLVPTSTPGVYTGLPGNRLVETTVDGIYILP